MTYESLVYNKTYVYPPWTNLLGLCGITLSSMACIPIGAVINFIRAPGSIKQVRFMINKGSTWTSQRKKPHELDTLYTIINEPHEPKP